MQHLDIEYIKSLKESDFIDFKERYHINNADLIHDIICLANADTPKNRFLIFGITDKSRTIIGIENDSRRKTQSDILDLLSKCRLNQPPIISLHTIEHDGHQVDILEIENRPNKPYFLLEDKKRENKTALRAGVVYTRYGDRNTAPDECAYELALERMFRERFGIDKPPLEKIKISLRNIHQWRYAEGASIGTCFYDEWNPEFTLSEAVDHSEKFEEGWNFLFPDSTSYKHEFHLKFHNTVLRQLYVVYCDGGRYVTILPNLWLREDKASRRYYESHFFINSSLEHLVNEMIQVVHPLGIRHRGSKSRGFRGCMPSFPTFSSEQEAKTALATDYERGMQTYVFYYFDRDLQSYVRVEQGQSHVMRRLLAY